MIQHMLCEKREAQSDRSATEQEAITSCDKTTKTTMFANDYQKDFSPVSYLRDRYYSLEKNSIPFHLDNSYTFLRNDAVCGNKLLDLGCGPNLINMIAAPDHFTHIVMADYAEPNLDFIRRWSRDDDVDFEWDHVCKYYSQKYNLGPSWEQTRLAILKSCIKDVVQCDVTKSEPLGPTYTEFFDCVFTSFCLEVASRDIDGYNQSIMNVSSLLRNGGHLIVRGVTGESCYTVGDKTFHTLPITVSQLRRAFTETGLKIRELRVEEVEDTSEITKFPGFCLLAHKGDH